MRVFLSKRRVGLGLRAGGNPFVVRVLKAFVDASRDDVYLRGITGDGRHCHGYVDDVP